MKIVITGSPMIGRTSLCLRLADHCIRKGLSVGGMVSKDMPDSGWEISDFRTGRTGLLASKDGHGERKGDYFADFDCLENLGVPAIENAVADCDVVLVDRIGLLEVHSKSFRQAYRHAFDSGKHVIASVDKKFAPVFVSGDWKRKIDNCMDISTTGVQNCYELVLMMYDRYLKAER